MRDLTGKVAFITGGASGIGLGIAHALAEVGMKVVIADLDGEHIDQAMAGFHHSPSVEAMQLDVTDREAFRAVADTIERKFGKVHVLCNNAGVGIGGPLKLATYDDWDWIMGVNLGGVINGIQTFLPRILAHGDGGHIVNTASMSGILPHSGAGLYITTKFAVVGFSEALRTELVPENVGVSVLCPGPVQTNIAQCGKTRPERFSQTGYADSDKSRKAHSISPLYMNPRKVGSRVLEAIRNNELYIFTHSEFRQGIQARCEAIMAAVPRDEPNPELMKAISFLLTNPIYSKVS